MPALQAALEMDWPIAVFSSETHTIPTGLSSRSSYFILFFNLLISMLFNFIQSGSRTMKNLSLMSKI
jgi:hypothetical protein